MTKIKLAMLAGIYAIFKSRLYESNEAFVQEEFPQTEERMTYMEAVETLTEVIGEQNVLVCPIKIGQKVYRLRSDSVIENTINEISFDGMGWYAALYEDYGGRYIIADETNWLKTEFPTREAAEAKLAEMRGKSDEDAT